MVDVKVVIDGLRDHADHLESDVVPDIDMAIQAAGSVSAAANADAYGVLCAPFMVPVLTSVEGATLAAMGACRDATSRFGQASNILANIIDACDIDNAEDIDDTGVEVVPMPTPTNPGNPVPMPTPIEPDGPVYA